MDDRKTQDALDALADLYLNQTFQLEDSASEVSESVPSVEALSGTPLLATDSSPTLEAGSGNVPAELVVLGHLPGFAAPWLTQYAYARAGADGRTLIIHVADDSVDLEVVGRSSNELRGVADELQLIDAVEQFRSADSPVDQILVHLTDPSSPTQRSIAAAIPDWTLLSGVDQLAGVAGTQLVMDLAGDSHVRRLRVALFGAPADEAVASGRYFSTLGELADVFEVEASVQRMTPVQVCQIGASGLNAEEAACLVQSLGNAPQANEAISELGIGEIAEPAELPGPNLAQFLTESLDGTAKCLEATCPRQESVRLLLDDGGTLHLMVRHVSAVDSSMDEVVNALFDARAWALEHLALLQLTQSGAQIDDAAEPLMHLFTDDAQSAFRLLRWIQHPVRFYLLKEVEVGVDRTWFCQPLS